MSVPPDGVEPSFERYLPAHLFLGCDGGRDRTCGLGFMSPSLYH